MTRTIKKIGNLRPTVEAATDTAYGTVKQIKFEDAIGEGKEATRAADDATVDAAAFNALVDAHNALLLEFNKVVDGMVAAGICTRP